MATPEEEKKKQEQERRARARKTVKSLLLPMPSENRESTKAATIEKAIKGQEKALEKAEVRAAIDKAIKANFKLLTGIDLDAPPAPPQAVIDNPSSMWNTPDWLRLSYGYYTGAELENLAKYHENLANYAAWLPPGMVMSREEVYANPLRAVTNMEEAKGIFLGTLGSALIPTTGGGALSYAFGNVMPKVASASNFVNATGNRLKTVGTGLASTIGRVTPIGAEKLATAGLVGTYLAAPIIGTAQNVNLYGVEEGMERSGSMWAPWVVGGLTGLAAGAAGFGMTTLAGSIYRPKRKIIMPPAPSMIRSRRIGTVPLTEIGYDAAAGELYGNRIFSSELPSFIYVDDLGYLTDMQTSVKVDPYTGLARPVKVAPDAVPDPGNVNLNFADTPEGQSLLPQGAAYKLQTDGTYIVNDLIPGYADYETVLRMNDPATLIPAVFRDASGNLRTVAPTDPTNIPVPTRPILPTLPARAMNASLERLYNQQMARYQADLALYNRDKAAYDAAVADWDLYQLQIAANNGNIPDFTHYRQQKIIWDAAQPAYLRIKGYLDKVDAYNEAKSKYDSKRQERRLKKRRYNEYVTEKQNYDKAKTRADEFNEYTRSREGVIKDMETEALQNEAAARKEIEDNNKTRLEYNLKRSKRLRISGIVTAATAIGAGIAAGIYQRSRINDAQQLTPQSENVVSESYVDPDNGNSVFVPTGSVPVTAGDTISIITNNPQ